MKIFLTGGTGFLGSHFLELALEAGHEVVALRRAGKLPVRPLPHQPNWIDASLDNIPTEAFEGCDVLVHLAAHGVNPSEANWLECFHWNVEASLKMWLDAAKSGVRRFVIAGSCFEYGSSGEKYDFIPVDAPLLPTGPYHSSKAAATMAALGFCVDQNREVIILRPFHIYGEGEGPSRFWPSLVEAAITGKDFQMTEGHQIRDFTHVKDVAADFLRSVIREDVITAVPIVENLGSGHPKSLLQFAADEWKRLGATGKLIAGAIPTRANEVTRYVPKLHDSSIR